MTLFESSVKMALELFVLKALKKHANHQKMFQKATSDCVSASRTRTLKITVVLKSILNQCFKYNAIKMDFDDHSYLQEGVSTPEEFEIWQRTR